MPRAPGRRLDSRKALLFSVTVLGSWLAMYLVFVLSIGILPLARSVGRGSILAIVLVIAFPALYLAVLQRFARLHWSVRIEGDRLHARSVLGHAALPLEGLSWEVLPGSRPPMIQVRGAGRVLTFLTWPDEVDAAVHTLAATRGGRESRALD